MIYCYRASRFLLHVQYFVTMEEKLMNKIRYSFRLMMREDTRGTFANGGCGSKVDRAIVRLSAHNQMKIIGNLLLIARYPVDPTYRMIFNHDIFMIGNRLRIHSRFEREASIFFSIENYHV